MKHFEKIINYEFNISGNINKESHKSFLKRYNKKVKEKQQTQALNMIESFYNVVTVFDPETNKPIWFSQKKDLTSKKQNVMIPKGKKIPTVGKIVTEFYVGK